MRFQATITFKTSSIAVDIACKELTKKMLDMASIPVASGSSKRRRFGRDHKKITLNRVKTIGWKSRRSLSINKKLGRCGFWFFAKEYSKRINRKNLLRIRLIEYWSLTTN
jgi:hypothetical protein